MDKQTLRKRLDELTLASVEVTPEGFTLTDLHTPELWEVKELLKNTEWSLQEVRNGYFSGTFRIRPLGR